MTTLGQMAPPKSGHPLRMPPESGSIPGRVQSWEVKFALMLSPGWVSDRFRRGASRQRESPPGSGSRVSGFGNHHWVEGFGFRVLVEGFGVRVFRVEGFGF